MAIKNEPAELRFFELTDLNSLQSALEISDKSEQITYIYQYLKLLQVKSIVIEPRYFDRDYLSEFSAFYSLSAKGYPNYCGRAHFFSEKITREIFQKALAQTESSREKLQTSYRGFTVIRPIETTPLGRTVLAWVLDKSKEDNPRVVKPSRNYVCNLCGIKLTVFGLAWQQQDQAVSACATVGLWTLLHSSAFNERYGIPTTVSVTRAANHVPSGLRTFPSRFLQLEQVCEAIKGHGLSPYLVEGDELPSGPGQPKRFSREKFCNTIASLVRSGFPCVIGGGVLRPGKQEPDGHINVCVGFRSKPTLGPSQMYADGDLYSLYIHDDNIGPAVRFEITHYDSVNMVLTESPTHPICLAPDNPEHGKNLAAANYGFFIPQFILAAVENNIRTSAEALIQKAIDVHNRIATAAYQDATKRGQQLPTLTVGTQYSTISDYLGTLLRDCLSAQPQVYAETVLELQEKVGPMSLYVGLVRLADTSGALIDVLYDTTDNDLNHPIFATICYTGPYAGYVGLWEKSRPGIFGGKVIQAY